MSNPTTGAESQELEQLKEELNSDSATSDNTVAADARQAVEDITEALTSDDEDDE